LPVDKIINPLNKTSMATSTYRIVIPTNVDDYQKLINNIEKQNNTLGDKSPLLDESEAIKQAVKDMQQAAEYEQKAEAARKESEKFTQMRNKLWKESTLVNERGWRKTLEGKYLQNIQQMSDFGYDIDRSPKKKESKTASKE
jgi:hypothetical protein